MIWLQWLGDERVVNVLQSFGIITGFLLTCVATWFTYKAFKRDDVSRKATNNFQLTTNHRELWSLTLTIPALFRVKSPNVDLAKKPVTDGEAVFVQMLILHLSSAYQMITKNVLDKPECVGADIRTFFALPIPHFVWEQAKSMQDKAFVAYVEANMGPK